MNILLNLKEIDEQLIDFLSLDEINENEILFLIQQRKQCLIEISQNKTKLEKKIWQIALERTEKINSLLILQRKTYFRKVQSLIKGKQSVQVYKKFE